MYYTYKLKVNTAGLNYTKLTTYYYVHQGKPLQTNFPLVAAGIKVKSWSTSDTKVCKVKKAGINGELGELETTGLGTCTITCEAKNRKIYKCKVTVVGGKTWGGLNGGYLPKISEVKKHGYYKDINTIQDYQSVVVSISSPFSNDDLKWGNGNKKLQPEYWDLYNILANRYPDREIKSAGGDYLCATSDNGKQFGRVNVQWFYVDQLVKVNGLMEK